MLRQYLARTSRNIESRAALKITQHIKVFHFETEGYRVISLGRSINIEVMNK